LPLWLRRTKRLGRFFRRRLGPLTQARAVRQPWTLPRRAYHFLRGARAPRPAHARAPLWDTLVAWLARVRLEWQGERARIPLHTNGCGDFTLASVEAWRATRAYAELEIFSMHLDSLFLYEAHYRGFREEFLPQRIYHLEHTHGFKPDEVRTLNTRLERAAIPQVTGEQFLRWVIRMRKTRRPLDFNDAAWGFAGQELPERELRVAAGAVH
jgi:hypothetical protein